MPYVETLIDRPDCKVLTPLPGIGADSAFRWVCIHWPNGADRPEVVTIRAIDGTAVNLTKLEVGWLLAACNKIPGRGVTLLPSLVADGNVSGRDMAINVDGVMYTITIADKTFKMNGIGIWVLCEALLQCVDMATGHAIRKG